ncbi:MAG TPA: hypothetical protein VIQ30_08550 [Pseudonocardia sp.]
MADLLDKEHVDAGLELLRADTDLVVYPDEEGNTPAPADRADQYVRVYWTIARPPDGTGNALDSRSSTWVVRWYCHCVGPNEYSSGAVAMRVARALLDQSPPITGRSCGRIDQEAETPPTLDKSTSRPVFDTVLVYNLITTG